MENEQKDGLFEQLLEKLLFKKKNLNQIQSGLLSQIGQSADKLKTYASKENVPYKHFEFAQELDKQVAELNELVKSYKFLSDLLNN